MITCIGAGPGDIGYLTRRGAELISNADVVAGFDAVVNVVRDLIPKEARVITMNYETQTARLAEAAVEHHNGRKVAVVFMGDIHFSGFQFLERVERACGHPVESLPGISSAQILASRAKVCFDETTFITLHRRGDLQPFLNHLAHALADGRNAIVIPCPWDVMPKDVSAELLQRGANPNHPVEVWSQLTRGSEAQWKGLLKDVPDGFSDMCIMLIRTLTPFPSQIEPA
jgi:cobalt-precorrin-7 (C5)-methyltransferase